MNFILIPQVGVYGAAIATCISYILVFVFRLFHTRKYIQYNINNKEFIVGSTALVLSAGLMFIDNRFGFLLTMRHSSRYYIFVFRYLAPHSEKNTKIKRKMMI